MPTLIQTVAAGAGGFDGTPGKGEFDVNAAEGIVIPNAISGVQLLAVAVNAEDPIADQNRITGVHVVFADSLASVNAGFCFIQAPIEGDVSHILFTNPLNGVIAVPGKIFVFADVQGVDNFTKTCLLAYRMVTHLPNASGIQG